ncbi:MAG: flagellar biosynthetic protein FliQ [Nitrospirae bacterium]|nr:MAG: flagellar biosynthetic protein FliQ [Nitrospirota bacterium]
MSPDLVLDIGRAAIETTLLVAGPMLGLSLLVGLLVSAFQAMTQINEATLTFVPKIVTVFLVILVGFPWLLKVFLTFTTTLLTNIPLYIK